MPGSKPMCQPVYRLGAGMGPAAVENAAAADAAEKKEATVRAVAAGTVAEVANAMRK